MSPEKGTFCFSRNATSMATNKWAPVDERIPEKGTFNFSHSAMPIVTSGRMVDGGRPLPAPDTRKAESPLFRAGGSGHSSLRK